MSFFRNFRRKGISEEISVEVRDWWALVLRSPFFKGTRSGD